MIFADMEIAEGAVRSGGLHLSWARLLGQLLGLGNLGIPLNWAEVQI